MHKQVNPLISDRIQEIRHTYLTQVSDTSHSKIWSGVSEKEDYITVTIVIPSKGCSWALSDNGGCSVCGYVNDSSRENQIPVTKIEDELRRLIIEPKYNKPLELQIFNSGSFFDKSDVPEELRNTIIDLIKSSGQIIKLSIECRPEFILKEKKAIKETLKRLSKIKLEIGIGLESSNNAILLDCWNKGTTLEDYESSLIYLQSIGVQVKSYVFIKPPFLSEQEALRDSIKTVFDAKQMGTDVISINPCNIQNGTLIYELFRKDEYQPPWLWTVLHLIMIANEIAPNIEIICDPTAAGKERGAHNCGKCDKIVLKLIEKAVQREKLPDTFSEICSCYLNWEILMNTPWESFRTRKLSKLRKLNPLKE
ncbi:MAG: archaeosine biosynthesis radical SAM protein RaSEA [Candidatus Heimdallarchaeota archaeon]|nr:archaeosine biosynthesis radical SAM protein RaSEA [Candidatus Heimdallarchaeota archaeon]